jgi:hypothetical protein
MESRGCISPRIGALGERCINYAEHGRGISKFCQNHFTICDPLYTRYKSSCSRAYETPSCEDIDTKNYTLAELQTLAEDLRKRYLYFLRCTNDRQGFVKQCIFPDCEDEGHIHFYGILDDNRKLCLRQLEHIANEITKRLRQEEIEEQKMIEQRREQLLREKEREYRGGLAALNRKTSRSKKMPISPEEEELVFQEARELRQEEMKRFEQEKRDFMADFTRFARRRFNPDNPQDIPSYIMFLIGNTPLNVGAHAIGEILNTYPNYNATKIIHNLYHQIEVLYNKRPELLRSTLHSKEYNATQHIDPEIFPYYLIEYLKNLSTHAQPRLRQYIQGLIASHQNQANQLILPYLKNQSRDYSPNKQRLIDDITRILEDKFGGPIDQEPQQDMIYVYLTRVLRNNINTPLSYIMEERLPPLMKRGAPINKLILSTYLKSSELEELENYILRNYNWLA